MTSRSPQAGTPPLITTRDYGYLVVAWVLLGLIESSQAYVQAQVTGRELGVLDSLIVNLPWWLLWAGLTPVAFRLATRVQFTGRSWFLKVQAGGIHFVAGTLLASLHLWLAAAVMYYTRSRSRGVTGVGEQFEIFFRSYYTTDLLTYVLLLAGFGVLTYTRRAAQLEVLATNARLDALRLQLNPHFLFNALNAVSGLVRRREHDEAVRMLAHLGDLLRTTLDADEVEVTLRRELEMLEQYLAIEQTRFHDRLDVTVAIPEPLLGAAVPSLILQPLVENAIRHGIGERPEGGSVGVSAARRGDRLVLQVTDTGPGVIERETLQEQATGIGVTNTRHRLETQFGSTASLRLRNLPPPDRGTVAEVELPYRVFS